MEDTDPSTLPLNAVGYRFRPVSRDFRFSFPPFVASLRFLLLIITMMIRNPPMIFSRDKFLYHGNLCDRGKLWVSPG